MSSIVAQSAQLTLELLVAECINPYFYSFDGNSACIIFIIFFRKKEAHS